MKQEGKGAAPSRKKATSTAAHSGGHANTGTGPFFQHYQAALQALQQGKYEKALLAFEQLEATAPAEMKERCRMYVQTCRGQMEIHSLTFPTPEEHYDYAVSLFNTGYLEEAREQMNDIVRSFPAADYAYYGLAILDSIAGRTQECLKNLDLAIELNPRNRLQARVDSDFQSMMDDPRFTDLLYPDVS